MKPFTQDMVRNLAFMGSSSIKKVLPAMVPDFSYEGRMVCRMAVRPQEGQEATFGETSAGECEKIYRDLVEYCQLDTMAMVKQKTETINIELGKKLFKQGYLNEPHVCNFLLVGKSTQILRFLRDRFP